jgi:hypothetical protein
MSAACRLPAGVFPVELFHGDKVLGYQHPGALELRDRQRQFTLPLAHRRARQLISLSAG